ncbi:MAG TPA: AAA family ATPase [Gallionella sp.]|jgi:aminoglycoside phosphotransferase family enzyme/predicted kinase|nr:AAA family ATPase [Gallionella sp.]
MKYQADQPPLLIRTLLTDPSCYDHAVGQIRLIETHISWVLLTGKFAYKIKKPLDLGFLDFSTLARRQHTCAEEVRLNRRLAVEIYIGVIAITGSPAAPQINGRGKPIEYAVKMHQFPPDATLDRLDESGELGIEQIDQIAARLAHFHLTECARAPATSPWGDPDSIARPVAENFQLLFARLRGAAEIQQLTALQNWSRSEHERLAPLMEKRKHDGWVRECHGDLHLGNLAWVDGQLLIFDCIEFDPALRWIDVISEVAFCFMDLLHRRRYGLAMRLLNAWLESTGDYAGVALLHYYAVYRALVRAKVAILRAAQSDGSNAEAASCLQLAESLTGSMPTQLWITHGLSGSGKTTLTQSLLQEQGMIRLRSDVERKRLAGLGALTRSDSGVGKGLYAQHASQRTYEHLARLAEGLLEAGWPVIIDAACLTRWQRDLFRDLARRCEVPFRILDIQVDQATLRKRISLRTAQGEDASEADLRVLQQQIETAKPLDADELSVTSVYPARPI